MSSEHRYPSQVPANKLYVSTGNLNGFIYDGEGIESENRVSWAIENPALESFGVILRDMGRTVYLPVDRTSASQAIVLRKIQWVTNNPVGTGGGLGDSFYTGFIQLGGLTYGGGSGTSAPVARLN